MRSVRTQGLARRAVLHRSVLDVIYLAATLALFALVALIAHAVEKLLARSRGSAPSRIKRGGEHA